MNTNDTFKLKVLSPEMTLFSGPVRALTVTAAEGELTVLKDHAPLIAELVSGDLRIQATEEVAPISLQSGFMTVKANEVTILKSS